MLGRSNLSMYKIFPRASSVVVRTTLIRRSIVTRPQFVSRSITTRSPAIKNAKKESAIKKLMKQYGYSALIVYIGITFISLPLCFLTVHSLGEERIGIYLNKGKRIFGYGEEDEQKVIERIREKKARLEEERRSGIQGSKWERFKHSHLLAEFLIAYGIHKSIVFIRIPVTAAITPSMSRLLRHWGFTKLAGGAPSSSTIAKTTASALSPNGVDIPKTTVGKSKKWFSSFF